jgi:hypothetical protein
MHENILFSDLPPHVKNAFTQPVKKETLQQGKMLFRFTLTSSNYRMSDEPPYTMSSRPSSWWSDIDDLKGILQAAREKNEDLATYVRKRSAVFKHWNEMRNLMVIKLNKPKTAFIGGVAPQQLGNRTNNEKGTPLRNEHKTKYYTKAVYLGGGFSQVYIPAIEQTDFSFVIPVGAVMITDPIDDILNFLAQYRIV